MIGKTNSIIDLYGLNPNFIPAIFHGKRRIVSYNNSNEIIVFFKD